MWKEKTVYILGNTSILYVCLPKRYFKKLFQISIMVNLYSHRQQIFIEQWLDTWCSIILPGTKGFQFIHP